MAQFVHNAKQNHSTSQMCRFPERRLWLLDFWSCCCCIAMSQVMVWFGLAHHPNLGSWSISLNCKPRMNFGYRLQFVWSETNRKPMFRWHAKTNHGNNSRMAREGESSCNCLSGTTRFHTKPWFDLEKRSIWVDSTQTYIQCKASLQTLLVSRQGKTRQL